jgi:FixJ family two-component response regulator
MSDPSRLVYLVDDDASVRKALTRLIASAGYRVEAFDSARAFLDRNRDCAGPACLVLDVQMPDLNGLDLQRELTAANSILPIVFITGHGDIPMSVRAMKAGAADFLTKPAQDVDLLGAIERAMARAVQDAGEQAQRELIRKRIDSLTLRERQVMALVVSGRLNKQIAGELGIVEKTVKVHRARVMQKMQARSLADLVRIAEKAGISLPATGFVPGA